MCKRRPIWRGREFVDDESSNSERICIEMIC